eukprot:2107559-Lingulodinium_polyedra.AAC.1
MPPLAAVATPGAGLMSAALRVPAAVRVAGGPEAFVGIEVEERCSLLHQLPVLRGPGFAPGRPGTGLRLGVAPAPIRGRRRRQERALSGPARRPVRADELAATPKDGFPRIE